MPTFTVEKCPQTYDEYKFVLDAPHLEKARSELNETDENRAQSLAQMREWIAKHPHIKKCRTDSIFLLRFLRMRKFSVPMAQESLERYLTALRSFPQWFRNLDPLDAEIRLFNKAGVLTNLGRDSLGRTVVLIRVRSFDTERFPSALFVRQIMLLLETTIEEEETQINGYVAIADYEGISLKLLSVWSLTDVSNAAESLFQSFPLRIQEIHAICVPKFFKIFADLALSCMSEKIRSRVSCHKSLDDAMKHLELSLLTTDYEGGTQNPDQLTEDFIKCAERKRTQLLLMDEMDIDTSRYQFGGQQNTVVSEIEAGMVGSFKKLNVD
ncbi:alpha-tocopherol transfer protein-like isoform X2 [Culex pipiens pallens]|uniref:alpha-tocopherol transfer protein-like isoform X2 n=1 Tax=Culex pipiens pallens TaxID=42434 RepID=UPI0019545AED|nr:alpha-tocopherol transfer protein-like isoform X2 [Culex pipiens pallens]